MDSSGIESSEVVQGGKQEANNNSSESGWTMYIGSPTHAEPSEAESLDEDHFGGEEEDDDSMASDASSGPSPGPGPGRAEAADSHERNLNTEAPPRTNCNQGNMVKSFTSEEIRLSSQVNDPREVFSNAATSFSSVHRRSSSRTKVRKHKLA